MRRLPPNRLTKEIVGSLEEDPRGKLLRALLRHGTGVHVVAGAVRDALVVDSSGIREEVPRDVDIGISNISRELFESVVGRFGEQNRHSGYVVRDGSRPSWDVWRMEDSIGLRKTGTPYTEENVLRTFNLSCNAIALNIRNGELLEGGAIRAIRQNQLSFVRDRIVHSRATFAAKAVVLQLRFGWTMDAEVERFVSRHLTDRALLHEARKVFPGLAILEAPLHDRSQDDDLLLHCRNLAGRGDG
jgi:hypothetical protein